MEHPPVSTAPSWLTELLDNRAVTDICINGPSRIYADSGTGLNPIKNCSFLNEDELKSWVLHQISQAGKTWDARYPFIDAAIPPHHRLHVAFPPLARQGILVSLRRHAEASDCEVIRGSRWNSSPGFDLLESAVARGDSILISGATGSGKTTLASDLLEFVPVRDRILALEDTPELAPNHPHFISMMSRPANADGHGEVAIRALLKQALRMRPDRIVLGECRGAEVLDLLQALNTGHRGALATVHANSPRDALRRIELLCLLASAGTVPMSAVRELLALGINWLVQVKKVGAVRHISEIHHVEGREGDTILLRPVLREENHESTPTGPTSKIV